MSDEPREHVRYQQYVDDLDKASAPSPQTNPPTLTPPSSKTPATESNSKH